MKYDMYELFNDYSGELPDIAKNACDTEHVEQLVRRGIRGSRIKARRNPKILVISIAAAAAAVTGITAAAYTDGFSHFREILSRTEPGNNISSELPLMHGDDPTGMEQNISLETVRFTGTDSAEVSTSGMYFDHNTLMLTVEMKLTKGTQLPSGAMVVPHFSLSADSADTELACSGISNAAQLIPGSEPDTYCATFYIVEEGIAGSKLNVRLEDIITAEQVTDVHEAVLEEQEKWREEFGFGEQTTEEWKQYWKDNDFDRRTQEIIENALAAGSKVISGIWTAQIDIPPAAGDIMTVSSDGFTLSADTLSIALDVDRELPFGAFAVPVVTLDDGTAIFTTGTTETEWLTKNGFFAENAKHENFAYGFGNVNCYKSPHPTEDIAQIDVYVFDFDDGAVSCEAYPLYKAE